MTEPLNFYGQPIVSPEYFAGDHVVNPMGAGFPPICACGWTPHEDFTMADHLRDMHLGPIANEPHEQAAREERS